MIDKLFLDHPKSVDETYFEHLQTASGFGWRLVTAGLACFVHGLFPFLFTKTGSNTIRELHHRMVTHRHRNAAVAEASTEAA